MSSFNQISCPFKSLKHVLFICEELWILFSFIFSPPSLIVSFYFFLFAWYLDSFTSFLLISEHSHSFKLQSWKYSHHLYNHAPYYLLFPNCWILLEEIKQLCELLPTIWFPDGFSAEIGNSFQALVLFSLQLLIFAFSKQSQ